MSLTRSYYCAICDMVALDARGALDYCLEYGRSLLAVVKGQQLNCQYKICVVDKHGIFRDGNQRLLKHLGLTHDEFVGRSISDIFPAVVARRRQQMLDKAIRSGKTVCFLDRRDGWCFETIIIPMRLQSYSRYDRALCMTRKIELEKARAWQLQMASTDSYVWERVEAAAPPGDAMT